MLKKLKRKHPSRTTTEKRLAAGISRRKTATPIRNIGGKTDSKPSIGTGGRAKNRFGRRGVGTLQSKVTRSV